MLTALGSEDASHVCLKHVCGLFREDSPHRIFAYKAGAPGGKPHRVLSKAEDWEAEVRKVIESITAMRAEQPAVLA